MTPDLAGSPETGNAMGRRQGRQRPLSVRPPARVPLSEADRRHAIHALAELLAPYLTHQHDESPHGDEGTAC